MSAAYVFAGSEMSDYLPSDGAAFEASGIVGGPAYDTEFQRCFLGVGSTSAVSSYAESPRHTPCTDFWWRGDVFSVSGPVFSRTVLSFLKPGSSVEVFRLTYSGFNSITAQMSYYDGSSYVNIGDSFALSGASVNTIVIHLVPGTGAAAIYMEGTLRASGTATMSWFTSIDGHRLGTLNQTACFSSVICSNEIPLIGKFLRRRIIDTPSATNTGGTGTVSDINELTYSDVTYNEFDTNGLVRTYYEDAADFSDYVVQAVVVSARAQKGVSGPANIQLALRSDGANYFSATKALDYGFGVVQNIWETDPATSAAWVSADAAASEGGVKAIT